jgi:hypothetical protein
LLRHTDVGAPSLIRSLGLELPIEPVLGYRQMMLRICGYLEGLGSGGLNTASAHQARYPILTTGDALLIQGLANPRTAVALSALTMDSLDLDEQCSTRLLALALRATSPGVVGAR